MGLGRKAPPAAELFGPGDPPAAGPTASVAFEPDVAQTLNNLGVVLGDLGEREAARQAYAEAEEIRQRLAP